MASLDPRVAALVDRPSNAADDDDEDALIAALEDSDSEPAGLRERRLEQLHAEFTRAKSLRSQDHGTYATIDSEKEILDITTGTKLSLVHFFKADFARCRIMDAHLKTLAQRHVDTRFLRADVENVPWLVERLKIQVLPCVIAFIDGKSVDRIIGFEGVGSGTDTITTGQLEQRLVACGALIRRKTQGDDEGRAKHDNLFNNASHHSQVEEDDDDDWD